MPVNMTGVRTRQVNELNNAIANWMNSPDLTELSRNIPSMKLIEII